jgi:hypothetical protein
MIRFIEHLNTQIMTTIYTSLGNKHMHISVYCVLESLLAVAW